MRAPILFIFSGLPATGKTTLAKMLAQHCQATYLRIDTIEQGLRDLCHFQVEGEGYRLSYRIARDNLLLGNSVVADSCNPIWLTRKEWQQVALDADEERTFWAASAPKDSTSPEIETEIDMQVAFGARMADGEEDEARISFVDIEICCSDKGEHRRRVEQRVGERIHWIDNLSLPDWEQIQNREYHPWSGEVIHIDTSHRTEEEAFQSLLAALAQHGLELAKDVK